MSKDMLTQAPEPIDLARRPDFRLGQLLFVPSACRVIVAGREQAVQRRVMEVMVALADMANRTVARDELIRRCWGGRVVGEDAVNRTVAKVRDLARGLDPPPFVLETIPKIGFRLLIAEEAPAEPAASHDMASPVRERGVWRLARGRRAVIGAALLALLLVAAAGVGLWRLAASRTVDPTTAATGRIEVAAFEPLQADPDLRRFSIATSDALVRMLTRVGLDAFQEAPSRGRRGAAELQITGSLDREGDAYVISPRIEDRAGGRVLWSSRLVRPSAAAPGFPEETANAIADTLNCGLQRRAAAHGEATSAVFGLLLSYCSAREDNPAVMLETARRLVAMAPRLSIGHSMLGAAAAWTAAVSLSAGDARALQGTARAEIERALQLDPNNGDAYFARAVSRGEGGDWLERERDLQIANQLTPDESPTRNVRVRLLREVGRLDEAMDLSRTAVAANPFRWIQLHEVAVMSAARGDTAEAQPLVDRLGLIDPAAARELRWTIAFWWTEPSAARALLRALAPADDTPCLDAYLARLVAARGAPMRGLPAACAKVSLDWRIRMLAREGDLDGAYGQLAAPLSPGQRSIFLFYPEMKAFRHDRRFMAYARRVGLVDYWTKSGHWPDFCSEADLPYSCRAAATAG